MLETLNGIRGEQAPSYCQSWQCRTPVGVFIPAYNAAAYLAQAIESVLCQTHADLDLLILDDASTDNTQEVVKPYLSDLRVNYLRNERNLGMSRNWNKGLSMLRNKFICKLDADDYYHPGFLAAVLPVFEQTEDVGLVFTGVNWISSRRQERLPYTESWVCSGRDFLQNLLREFVLHSPTVCVRRQCYDRLGFFVEKMRIHSDWEMWVRICCSYKIGYVNKVLATYRKHQDNCTAAAEMDSRTPDDLDHWLRLLNDGELPYELSNQELFLLERNMALMVRRLLFKTLFSGRKEPALSCARFLAKRRWLPLVERTRYYLIWCSLSWTGRTTSLLARGRRVSDKNWEAQDSLRIRLPAMDPQSAIVAF